MKGQRRTNGQRSRPPVASDDGAPSLLPSLLHSIPISHAIETFVVDSDRYRPTRSTSDILSNLCAIVFALFAVRSPGYCSGSSRNYEESVAVCRIQSKCER
jgi:hypothetical protein